ncbi:DUF2304 domain-containing protein [uncultured Methanobrevibacter sp.]|uniref:DUF2304 domain-containing protein n=1 Tax=uncultured Methanobrevibacter sp. TaxID=253161 RepID=UPI00344955E0
MIIGIVFIYIFYIKYKKHEIRLGVLLLWSLFWIIAIIITFLGDFTSLISKMVGFGRGLDMIFAIAIGILVYFSYYTIRKMNDLNENISKLNKILNEKNKK